MPKSLMTQDEFAKKKNNTVKKGEGTYGGL